MVDLQANSYREVPSKPIELEPAAVREDVQILWLDYDPDYDWTVKETDETKDIGGFHCGRVEAIGEADLADISATYWISKDPQVRKGRAYRDFMIRQFEEIKDRGGHQNPSRKSASCRRNAR